MGADLLAELRLSGLRVTLDGDRVLVGGPLTDTLRERIRAGKLDLVAALRDADPRVTCYSCKHHSPGKCANHKAALLQVDRVGHDLAVLLQNCPGWGVRA